MTAPLPESEASFDGYAAAYDAALDQGLSVSGESKEYFARGRVQWLRRRFGGLGFQPQALLDFGCGTGTATPFLRELPGPPSLVGVDISKRSLEVAQRDHGGAQVHFHPLTEYKPEGRFDLAYCNGVFHHIPLAERSGAVHYVFRALRPGGLFAFWENNPWNPGTRYVMSRIPFDRDAIPLSPPGARGLLCQGGFEVLRTDFLFIFPRCLSWFRWLEPIVASWPLGAQYQVLCRKPSFSG